MTNPFSAHLFQTKSFSKQAKIEYVKLVKSKSTGNSKGTGFVRFLNKPALDDFLKRAIEESTIRNLGASRQTFKKLHKLNGAIASLIFRDREIFLFHSIPSEKAKEKSEKKHDKRNLHLFLEGCKLLNCLSLAYIYKSMYRFSSPPSV